MPVHFPPKAGVVSCRGTTETPCHTTPLATGEGLTAKPAAAKGSTDGCGCGGGAAGGVVAATGVGVDMVKSERPNRSGAAWFCDASGGGASKFKRSTGDAASVDATVKASAGAESTIVAEDVAATAVEGTTTAGFCAAPRARAPTRRPVSLLAPAPLPIPPNNIAACFSRSDISFGFGGSSATGAAVATGGGGAVGATTCAAAAAGGGVGVGRGGCGAPQGPAAAPSGLPPKALAFFTPS